MTHATICAYCKAPTKQVVAVLATDGGKVLLCDDCSADRARRMKGGKK